MQQEPLKEREAAAHYIKLFNGWPDADIQQIVERVWELRDFAGICSMGGLDPGDESASVLDVAGGLTTVTRLLAARRRCVLDICFDALRDAGFSFPIGIDFITGSAEAMPFPDRSFRHIFCTNAFDHFEHPERALHEMNRVLEDDGTCVVVVTVHPLEEAKGPRNILHPQTFTAEAAKTLISQVFTITAIQPRPQKGNLGYNRAARGKWEPRSDNQGLTFVMRR